jgi:hypothetical protein
MGYDEELSRVINFGSAAKAAIPGVLVAAPSTDSWWYCEHLVLYAFLERQLSSFPTDWTSIIGYSDNTAHNNIDFIPWFLTQMKNQGKVTGKRLLDYLDIHYYFAADTSAMDAAAKALLLRGTRSLWVSIFVLKRALC